MRFEKRSTNYKTKRKYVRLIGFRPPTKRDFTKFVFPMFFNSKTLLYIQPDLKNFRFNQNPERMRYNSTLSLPFLVGPTVFCDLNIFNALELYKWLNQKWLPELGN